uniref:Methionine adenosyltransferase 2 subunit beta n=1 Tax=Timema californicum TaxID=61474 RepID=A0A7R9IXB3_TIMCA|nr:unnamed protein product [Timema californicum]
MIFRCGYNRNYSSLMASLVLTDSSQLTSDNQYLDTIKAPMIYISTDYVFDGKSPPFSEDDTPNPLNLYGKTKLQGELATLSVNPGENFNSLS